MKILSFKNSMLVFTVLSSLAMTGLLIHLASGKPLVRESAGTHKLTVLVEFAKKPDQAALAHLRKFEGVTSVQRFDSWNSDYFSRLYKVEIANSQNSESEIIQNLKEFSQNNDPISNVEFSKTVMDVNFALEPGDQTRDINDPYTNYQWGLHYTGQKIIRDYTDIQSDTITAGNQSPDIGLDPDHDVDQLMKNDVVVAVLDSGVDLAHPDLVKNLYHNTAECLSDGSIPLNPSTDNDGNGYNGDCMGWNFVTDSGDGTNRPDDDLGHGTHVAGILAAEKNNKLGVSGISNRIKILPVRITWAQESPGKKTMALTDRIAKGILYAAKMKAKVVNISMGWPNSTDSAFLRNAFAAAINSGVTVVAAAGNNSTNIPVFPCAYTGVICVGATSLDGRLAPFSNYGSHVDVSAPGEEILSTYPISIPSMGVPPAAYFSDPRYEILSGTSMAAPFVTGAVAVLKGIYPNISEREIKARLFASSQNLVPSNLSGDFANSYIQFGTIKIANAINMTPQPVVAPDFKGLDRVTYSVQNKTFSMVIPVDSYWTPAQVAVSVASGNANFKLLGATSFALDFSDGAPSKVIRIAGQLTDLHESSLLTLKVAIDVPGQGRHIFSHDFQANRSIVNDPAITKIPMTLKSAPRTLSLLSLNKVNPTDASEFYWTDAVGFHVMKNQGGTYTQFEFPALTPQQSLLSLMKVPAYTAKGPSYWVGGIVTNADNSKYISYHFFDKNLQAINGLGEVHFAPETVVIDQGAMANLNFVPTQTSGGLTVPTPVFQTQGAVPSADQDKNWTHFADNSTKRPGIFFLVPQKSNTGWSFQTRLFDNFQFVAAFKQRFQLSPTSTVTSLHLLPQGTDKSKIQVLMSYGETSLRRYVVISATLDQLQKHDFTVVGNSAGSTQNSTELDHAVMTQVQTSETKNNPELVFTAPISQKSADLVFMSSDAKQIVGRESLSPSFRYDTILSLISSFYDGKKYYSFMESTSHLILHVTDPNGKPAQFETNIQRSSLLPGQMFSESFRPVRYTTAAGEKKAALYGDATQISANHVFVNVADDQKGITTPLNLNVDVPPNCLSMAPQAMISADQDDIVLLCRLSASTFEFQILPIAE